MRIKPCHEIDWVDYIYIYDYNMFNFFLIVLVISLTFLLSYSFIAIPTWGKRFVFLRYENKPQQFSFLLLPSLVQLSAVFPTTTTALHEAIK
jgi:hypothetical protein